MRIVPGPAGLLPLALSLATIGAASIGGRQQAIFPVRVPSTPSCATCEIAVQEAFTIGVGEDDGALSTRPEVVLRLSSGNILVAGMGGSEGVPRLYGSRGRYLRTLGRSGAGPGEFNRVQAGFVDSDSVFLFDIGNARLSVLSPDLRVVRYAPTPRRVYAAVPTVGGFAVSADFHDADRVGFPLHLFERSGAYSARIGDKAEAVILGGGTRSRHLSSARDGGFWALPAYGEYVLRRFDSRGLLLRELVVESDWYSGGFPLRPLSPDALPQTIIYAVREDRFGRLWVIARVGDARWREGLGPVTRVEGRNIAQVLDPERVYDGIIEVVDPATARVLARRRFDYLPSHLLSDDLAASYSITADGEPMLRILSIALRRR